ncbi:glycoside hydrolase [Cladophialophora carrionii]|uniref:Glycoside hydrolase n=1 Tax=Cladophialophora carrionii TaxID=86049 RepID=A0A1C1CFM4_9EURO|nr:glycoside hydrolase [Cladophialophora carrionii]
MAQWVSFEDMFNANKGVMRVSCVNLGSDNGPDDSEEEIDLVLNAVQYVSYLTNVDHRFILAILLQESKGCVRVRTTNNGVPNPGLMQAHDGAFSCNMRGNLQTPCPASQIFGMIFDGVGGTSTGDGLAKILNQLASSSNDAQAYYRAARQYNTGSIAQDGDLDVGGRSTNCYASDVANRLTGWVWAESACSL